MLERFSLRDKNALVTGGTRGIGLAIARGFLEAGARVTICGRKPEGVEHACRELSDFGENVQGLAAHVGDPDDRERLLRAVDERFGPLGVLVNNAATNPHFGPVIDADLAAWDKTMDVNLRAPYALSCLAARMMRAQGGGSIINMASAAGLTAAPGQGIYSVSKAGLIMLTRVLARELGPHAIRVNCICPGVIKTDFSRALWSTPDAEEQWSRLKALGRVGEADEVVGAAIYLASGAASFTTGAVLQVDGGLVL